MRRPSIWPKYRTSMVGGPCQLHHAHRQCGRRDRGDRRVVPKWQAEINTGAPSLRNELQPDIERGSFGCRQICFRRGAECLREVLVPERFGNENRRKATGDFLRQLAHLPDIGAGSAIGQRPRQS
jgi:hypothetical protein